MKQLSAIQHRNFTLLKVFLVGTVLLLLLKTTESVLKSSETALPQVPHPVESRG